MMNKMTIEEDARKWVGEFNFYPHDLLERAYPDMDGLEEITPVSVKYECDECGEEFSEEEYNELGDGDGIITCPSCYEKDEDTTATVEPIEDYDSIGYGLPMWGTLFNPKERLDEDWIRENLEEVKECGFRIYESEEVGILLGVDGAGYDFYEEHWIPLYKARGLKWHTVNQ